MSMDLSVLFITRNDMIQLETLSSSAKVEFLYDASIKLEAATVEWLLSVAPIEAMMYSTVFHETMDQIKFADFTAKHLTPEDWDKLLERAHELASLEEPEWDCRKDEAFLNVAPLIEQHKPLHIVLYFH